MKTVRWSGLAVVLATSMSAQAPARLSSTEWGYGGGPRQTRYSPLDQITRNNVATLTTAWTYDTSEIGALQTQPVVVDGVLYGYTASHKLFALNAATGARLWVFDPGVPSSGPNRGVMYLARRRRNARVRGSRGLHLGARRADGPADSHVRHGRAHRPSRAPRSAAGDAKRTADDAGRHLSRPDDCRRTRQRGSSRLTGGRPRLRRADGRAAVVVPHDPHPGEFGYETWPKDAWTYSGGANSWPGMALDDARGVVYVPTGSAASDFYGADRLGDNLFANSLVALDASTGKRLWHFQFVRHDIWDRDLPSPPSLITLRQNGRTIEAVAQATKHGYVFVFDRTNGQPIFPIEYRPYPSSTVPGEVTHATQPIPTKPAPFARQLLTADLLSTRTPAVRQWALEQFKTFESAGQFIPFSVNRQTVIFPGFDGGAEWGGQAFDQESGLYYVNAKISPGREVSRQTPAAAADRRSIFSTVRRATATTASARRRRFRRSSALASAGRSPRWRRSSGRAQAACPDFPHSINRP